MAKWKNMAYPEEKFRKLVKIGLFLVGLFLIFSLFSLFFGGNSSRRNSYPATDGVMSSGFVGGNKNFSTSTMSTDSVQSLPEVSYDSSRAKTGMIVGESLESAPVDSNSGEIMTDKKVIKNGNLNLKIENADESARKISEIAKAEGGEVFSTNFYETARGQKSGFVTIKVPVDKFEETVNDLKKIATQVINESTTGQDVTEQYSDLQAQLKNKRAEEESFVKILDTAGKIDDILAVTRELSRVRGEIERLEGRIRFMDSQTDMSTITINLTEDVTVVPVNEGWRPWQVVKQSVKELISNMQGFVDGLIRFIIVGIPSLVPFALLVVFLIWIGRKIYRKIIA